MIAVALLALTIGGTPDCPFQPGEALSFAEPDLKDYEYVQIRPVAAAPVPEFQSKFPDFVSPFFDKSLNSGHFLIDGTAVSFWVLLFTPSTEPSFAQSTIDVFAQAKKLAERDASLEDSPEPNSVTAGKWIGFWEWTWEWEPDDSRKKWDWTVSLVKGQNRSMLVSFRGEASDVEKSKELRNKLTEVVRFLAFSTRLTG